MIQHNAPAAVADIGASIGINVLWIGSTPNPSVSSVVAPSSTRDFGRPHRIIVDADVRLGDGNNRARSVGAIHGTAARRRDTDPGENLFRDLGEQRPGIDKPLQLDPALGQQRMAHHELDRERPHGAAIVGDGAATNNATICRHRCLE